MMSGAPRTSDITNGSICEVLLPLDAILKGRMDGCVFRDCVMMGMLRVGLLRGNVERAYQRV